MVLEDLVQTIIGVRERAEKYKSVLQRNEALTRNALVEPILRVLGWDPEDPELVEPEYKVSEKSRESADYALKKDGRVVIIVEVKNLGQDLSEHVRQAIKYCIDLGVDYLVLTNGIHWLLYKAFVPGKRIEERLIVEVDLVRDALGDAALKLLALWRPAEEMFGKPAAKPVLLETRPSASRNLQGIPLSGLEPREYLGKNHPAKLLFPDGSEAPLRSWKDVLKYVAHWLYRHGHITKEICPITMKGMTRYIIHTKPRHERRMRDFFEPFKIDDGIYLETHWNTEAILRITQYLANKYGPGSDKFALQF